MKNETKHTSHSMYRLESYIVFAPKYRRQIPRVVQSSNKGPLHTIRELKEISLDEINKRTI